MATTEYHEKALMECIEELKAKGYRVIDLERKSPDAIAIKDNQIFAVEVLGIRYRKGKGWGKTWTPKAKETIYHMFDGILFKTFRYPIGIKEEQDSCHKMLLKNKK